MILGNRPPPHRVSTCGADVGGSAVMPQKKSQVMACCAATGTAYRRQA